METKNSENNEFTYNELLSQKKTLSEELLKCKQDKDFVWKLWKDLQVENPSTTNIINSVIEREQEKSDAKDLKVLMIFEQKDKQINILQEVSEDLQTQASLSNERISELLIQITDWQKKTNDAEGEKNRLKSELEYKEELLKTKEKQSSLAENSKKDVENKMNEQLLLAENSKKEVKNKINKLLRDNSFYQKTIDRLTDKLEEACEATEDLKVEFMSKDDKLKVVSTKLDDEMRRKLEVINENEEQNNKINRLKETIAKKSKVFYDINRNLEIQDDQIKNNKQTIRDLTEQLEERTIDIQHLRGEIRSYENYPKQIKEQIHLIQNLEKLQDETQHVLSQQEVTHQQEINTHQNTIYELKVIITKLQNDATRISSENKTLRKSNSKLESTSDALHERENSLQHEVVSVSLELESLKNKLNIMSIEQAKNNQDKYKNINNSVLSSCTQTTPSKVKSTQTEEYLLSDESEQSSLKVKRKKEKLHKETQRLLTLKSEINQENRTLKKRILVLENQCNQLHDEKALMGNDAKHLRENNEKLKDEIVETFQKLKVTTDVLQKRSKQLEECSQELQTISANQLKEKIASKNISTKLNSAEEELHVATTNCSKLSFQLKTVCGENEILMEKQKSFQERISKLDILLNQKKYLIDELKIKYNEAKNESEKKSETIENINTKLKVVTERENKDKIYIEKLKTKMNDLIKEKANSQRLVDVLKTETERKTQLLQETHHICHQAETAITAMEYTASQQIKKEHLVFKDKEAELNSRYNKSMDRVNELRLVVKNFAESLLLQICEKRGNVFRKNKPPSEEKEDIFKKKACDVACSILNMSAADLEEFMKDDVSSDTALQKYEDNDIREKLELILRKQDNFEKILTHFLLDLVEYYWSLCAEEIQDND